MPITDDERAHRNAIMEGIRERSKLMRQQVQDAQWKEVIDLLPTVSVHEADIVAGIAAYCAATPSTEWSEQSVTTHVQHYAYDMHPGDEEFRWELGARLRNMIERRRLNAGEMSHDMGWEDILHEFLSAVELLPGFRLRDAGEKWGMLRLRYDVDDRTLVADAERRAVEQSMKTCEFCGEPGQHHKGGWWKTVCEKHADYYKQTSDPWREIKACYSDVYQPDPAPYARDIECKYGWSEIIKEYLDQLRAWQLEGFDIRMRWAKEKFGSLRVFSDLDYRSSTRLETYWVERLNERIRRLSLTVCDMCGQQGRLRFGRYLATRCDEHAAEVGSMRPEDGIILDADRQHLVDGRAVTTERLSRFDFSDAELGLDQGRTIDSYKSFGVQFTPLLAPAASWPDDEATMTKLREKLLAVDRAIGRHHSIRFRLHEFGERTYYTVDVDPIYVEHAISDVDEIMREQIVEDIHDIMRGDT